MTDPTLSLTLVPTPNDGLDLYVSWPGCEPMISTSVREDPFGRWHVYSFGGPMEGPAGSLMVHTLTVDRYETALALATKAAERDGRRLMARPGNVPEPAQALASPLTPVA